MNDIRNSEMERLLKNGGIPELFKNSDMKYEYNEGQRIYSVKVALDNRPRVLTLRMGDDFTELSLSDKEGKLLEKLKHEDGKGVTFSAAVR